METKNSNHEKDNSDFSDIQDDKNSAVVSLKPDEEISTKCGYWRCAPDCLQGCARPGVLLAFLCMFAMVETFVQWGLINVMISTWERRYNLKSTQSVWIVAAQDITSAICSPVFGYFALFWHKGRMVTAAAICMVIGNFLFLVPQFASDPYVLGGMEVGGVCDLSDNSTSNPCTTESSSDQSYWLSVFIIAQLFFGYAGSSLWTVGITYMDDNCKHESMVLYLGIFNALSALGATLGFIGGGFSLEVYVDVGRVDMEELNLDSSEPGWVGAWWIGFAAALVMSLPLALFMPCFPQVTPKALEIKKNKKSLAYKGKGEKDMARADFGKSWADVGQSLKIIFSNPVFVLMTVGGIIEMGSVTAMAAFLPKVIQFQFGQTPSMAAFIAGVVLVPGSIIGQLLGGVIPRCAKLNFKQIIYMQVTAAYLCIFCAFGFLARCDLAEIAGFNAEYAFNSTLESADMFDQACNEACDCTTLLFEPICGTDGTSYFSPCYGACATEDILSDGSTMYGNCSCLPNATLPEYQAQKGLCPVDCGEFWIFVPLFLLMTILTFIENTAGYATVMRAVPEKQRTFAFGVQSPIIKLLGTVPIPLLFGYTFDLSCDIWQDICGTQGSCWIYNTKTVALGLFISGILVKAISGSCFLAAVLVYKPPPGEEKDHEIIVDNAKTDDVITNGSATDGAMNKAVSFDELGDDKVVSDGIQNGDIHSDGSVLDNIQDNDSYKLKLEVNGTMLSIKL